MNQDPPKSYALDLERLRGFHLLLQVMNELPPGGRVSLFPVVYPPGDPNGKEAILMSVSNPENEPPVHEITIAALGRQPTTIEGLLREVRSGEKYSAFWDGSAKKSLIIRPALIVPPFGMPFDPSSH